MNNRVVILSDTHLGLRNRETCFVRALRPLWRGATHLVLNGDVAELQHPTLRARAARAVLALCDHCERDNVTLTLLSGNHDSHLSDLRHLHLANGRIFVTHGDALHPAIAPWCTSSRQLREAHDQALAAMPLASRTTLEGRLAAVQHATHMQWSECKFVPRNRSLQLLISRPWRIWWLIQYWRRYPGLADRFADQHAPDARFVVFGHTHRQGTWVLGRRVIINTGSFAIPGRPRAVVIEPKHLAVYRIHRCAGTFQLARSPLDVFDMNGNVADRNAA